MKRTVIFILAVFAFAFVTEGRQPQRGYRGFLEWSGSYRTEKTGIHIDEANLRMEREGYLYSGITTSHGYQINSMFFVGAGIGLERCGKSAGWIAPVFVQGRVDLKFGKFTPFGDLRLGANLSEGAGVYFSPTVGYRFNWGRKMGVNLGLGLELVGYKIDYYYIVLGDDGILAPEYIRTGHSVRPYFSFRIGFDF